MSVLAGGNGSAPTWWNWSGNIEHLPPSDGEPYYFTPTNLTELQAVVAAARSDGKKVRVSGQRHSQTPLVTSDNRGGAPASASVYLVDMSCYVDVGDAGIELGPGENQVTVNPGVREDDLDAFLTKNSLMFKTVTAGGFFSIGGMTAVDVHGGSVQAPIFAETASAFTILDASGNQTVIDASTPAVDGWKPIQFARVSLGGLGIVTRVTIDVVPRPAPATLQGNVARHLLKDKPAFVAKLSELLTGPSKFDRMEVFYTPYAAAPNVPFVPLPNFLVLGWNEVDVPAGSGSVTDPPSACELAERGSFGASSIGGIAGYSVKYVRASQYYSDPYNPFHFPPIPSAGFCAISLDEIESQANAANKIHSDLWLSEATQVMFMSYFIEMPNLDEAALENLWDGLDVVAKRVIQNDDFHIAAPVEFRFIKAGDSAMAGTYSENPDAHFVNLDLIAFIEPTRSADYPEKLLQFFADVEREWVAMGGFPHNGKMYGFYDPTAPAGSYTAAFNENFLADLRTRRGARLAAFNDYRKSVDPTDMFCNDYLAALLGP